MDYQKKKNQFMDFIDDHYSCTDKLNHNKMIEYIEAKPFKILNDSLCFRKLMIDLESYYCTKELYENEGEYFYKILAKNMEGKKRKKSINIINSKEDIYKIREHILSYVNHFDDPDVKTTADKFKYEYIDIFQHSMTFRDVIRSYNKMIDLEKELNHKKNQLMKRFEKYIKIVNF